MKAVILAAGHGTRLEPLTRDLPKCLAPVAGTTILDRLVQRLEQAGVGELVVVTGYLHHKVEAHLRSSASLLAQRAVPIFNPRHADWGNFHSLLVARDALADASFIRVDGDVVVDADVLPAVLAAPGPGVLAVDRSPDLGDEEMKARIANGQVVELNKRMAPAGAAGEFIGVDRIDSQLAPHVFATLEAMIEHGETDEYYERAYERLMLGGHGFGWADVTGMGWTEIDTLDDLARADELAACGRL
jgi:choline kinase